MCGVVPLAMGKHKSGVLGAIAGGIPGALIGNSMDKKRRDKPRQRFGDGTVVDGAMS